MLLLMPALISADHEVSSWVRYLATPALDPIAVAFTTLGGFAIMATLTLAVSAWLLWRGSRAEAILLAGTVAFGSGAGQLLKMIAGRERPALEFARIPQPSDLSFPSGHALTAFLFFGTLVFLVFTVDERLSLKAKVLVSAVCVLLIVAISMSRVYLGVHYLGDIVGGWLLGGAIMTVTVGIYVSVTGGRTSSGQ